MPNNQTQRLTHGAMMIAIFAILIAIAYYVPIISLVATLFAPLPIAWFSAKYDRSSSIILGVIGCIITFFFGGLLILPFSMIFAVCGVVMGDALRTNKSKAYLFMATGISVLITFAIQYLISIKLFERDFIKESFQLMRESYMASFEFAESLTGEQPMTEEAFNLMFQHIEIAIPATVTLAAFFLSFLLITVNLPILKRLGITVPKFQAFKDLRLPRTILWIYLIVLTIQLFVRPELGTSLYVITFNFSLVLWVLLTIQGISFLHFVLDAYRAPKFLKGLATIFAIPLYNFVMLLGILDLGFDIRSFVTGKIRK
ncbi:YybS family protein [Ureibacillus sp. FSL K6-2830]|uniref:YybS family protein n=1 Tax=Ureibacillus sp. FSL K6-2830 TaxID=2954610 RepID=UPI0030F92417